jgi:putative ABC transport system ATP-binding protein
VIKISDLCKSFGSNHLFTNFSLTVDTGEIVALCGASGSGKTTLLNIIGALEKFDKGVVTIDDIDVNQQRNHRFLFKEKVGFVFQNFVLIDDKTVRQNLRLVTKVSSAELGIDQALERVGLAHRVDDKVYTLSGGEQQRVALARLMVKKCDVILADEPTGSLDRGNAQEIVSILEDLHRAGKTVVVVTHDESIMARGWRVVNL